MTASELRLRRVSHRGEVVRMDAQSGLDQARPREARGVRAAEAVPGVARRDRLSRRRFPVAEGKGKLRRGAVGGAGRGAARPDERRRGRSPPLKLLTAGQKIGWDWLRPVRGLDGEHDDGDHHALARPFSDLAPLSTAAADYDVVRRAIAHIRGNWRAQPEIEQIAEAAGVTPTELHHLFRRWAGLTPKAFLQALTLDSARNLLRDSASVLDASYEVGLSGPGRLHDLFVTHEAMSPGEWKSGGEGLTIHYGFHPVGVRHRAGDGDRARPVRARLRRSRRGAGGARRHAPPLAEGELRRGLGPHRAALRAHLRQEAVARGPAAARRADRHRLRGAGVGDAAAHPDGPRHHLFRHRRQHRPAEGPARGRRRGRQEPDLASWCRATA